MTREHKFLGGNRGNLCVESKKKYLYASSQKNEKSDYERSKERDYKGLRRAQVALPVWPAHHRIVPREKRVSGDPL